MAAHATGSGYLDQSSLCAKELRSRAGFTLLHLLK